MKNLFVTLSLIVATFTASTSFAKILICSLKLNNNLVVQNDIHTLLKEKVAFAKTDSIRAYVTENDNDLFSVEAFVGDYEIRIYADGVLKTSTDRLNLTLWGRDSMIDAECKLLQ